MVRSSTASGTARYALALAPSHEAQQSAPLALDVAALRARTRLPMTCRLWCGGWLGASTQAYPDYGIYTYANGDRYGGSWKQGKKMNLDNTFQIETWKQKISKEQY